MKTTFKMNELLYTEIKKIAIDEKRNIDTFVNEFITTYQEKIKIMAHNKNHAIIELLKYKEKTNCVNISDENREWCQLNSVKYREAVILGIYLYMLDNKLIKNNINHVFETMKKIELRSI